MRFRKICILVGENCNFNCKHCITSHRPKNNLTSKEKKLIIREINKYDFKRILFVGGETTLYIKDINQILSKIKNLQSKNVKITTNGYFANTIKSAKDTLLSFIKLNSIQLSYDVFHAEFLSIKNIENLYRACKEIKKGFSVILTIQSPLGLKLIKELKPIGKFPIGVQKVLPIGKALWNGLYYKYPSFDKNVLLKTCPGVKEIVYICNRGFTVCCSNLVYNDVIKGITHKSIKEHVKSKFYQMISSYNFKELAKILNVSLENLPPTYSSECNLCEYIFKKREKQTKKSLV